MQALCKQRDIPLMLLSTVRHSESAEVRLLGSQTLRRNLKVHWRQLSKEVRHGAWHKTCCTPPKSASRWACCYILNIIEFFIWLNSLETA